MKIIEMQGRCPLDLQPVIMRYEVIEPPKPATKPHCLTCHDKGGPCCEGSPIQFRLLGRHSHHECIEKFRLMYRAGKCETPKRFDL